MKLMLYESTYKLCEAIMNWTIFNRKSLSKIELENYTKRAKEIQKNLGLALSKENDSYGELIKVSTELNVFRMELESKYQTHGRLETDIEQCFTEFEKNLHNHV